MFRVFEAGSSRKTEAFLESIRPKNLFKNLDRYGRKGVDALAEVTPVRSGLTARSWDYRIEQKRGSISIIWTNDNDAAGTPIVLLLQYGHGTGTGGFVPGHDFINPAIKPVFDQILQDVWGQVTNG